MKEKPLHEKGRSSNLPKEMGSDDESLSDMGALMSKMQSMMQKMNNVENMAEEEAEKMLQKLLKEVGDVSNSTQGQLMKLMNSPEEQDFGKPSDTRALMSKMQNVMQSMLKNRDDADEMGEEETEEVSGVANSTQSQLMQLINNVKNKTN